MPRKKPGAGQPLPATDAPSSRNTRIELPRVDLQWVRVEIIGTSPLIVNRFREEALRGMEGKQQGEAKTKKPPRKPEVEFFESNHICLGYNDPARIKDCLFGFPAIGLKKAVANAAYRFGGTKDVVSVASSLFMHGPYGGLLPIYDASKAKKSVPALPTMRRDPVVLSGGTASIAYRPAYFPWKMEVDVRYWPAMMSLESLVNGIVLAGQFVGIGAWRIEKKGDKGAFTIGRVQELPRDYVPETIPATAI